MTETDRRSAQALRAIKLVHPVIWAFFAGCIVAIPVLALQDRFTAAAIVSGIVFVECLIIVASAWRCPLTGIAARYTDDRRDNFDIYLPEWLARHNKLIFGLLCAGGLLLLLARWAG